MKYLTYNGYQLATKNKLQEAIQTYLNCIDRTLINDGQALADIKTKIIAHIVFFNNEYPRCKPIRASWYSHDKKDWLLSGVDFANFHIYQVKTDYKYA
ncbi:MULTISPECIES: hypothetical protein [Bizionia]|uniref:Uncharacterized protein n=1 Tax=Bizionia algoritergicola TaxID=291187 RepID=A0A5D0QM22_9FLAO|nr:MULTISPECIES: hypothetical protein [Bizionia]OBX17740.1 hypothetical protein BAA08_15870 [Bizionia sp. APA-3]TYB69478.1 hypothetical protein ES675_16105 [Bizionia algoritergicola]